MVGKMDSADKGTVYTSGCFYTSGGYMKNSTSATTGARWWDECTLHFNAGFGSKVRPYSRACIWVIKYI